MSRSDRAAVELPRMIKDAEKGVSYEKGRFLGKGGFAKCYEFVNQNNKVLYAGKVVPKTLLQKSHQKVIFSSKKWHIVLNVIKKEKMAQEIELHRSLEHDNIVKFVSSFQGN